MQNTIDLVPSQLRKYAGLRFHIEDPFQRAEHMAFTFANECLAGPETPFGRMSRNGLLLCEETRSFLYEGDFGILTQPYRSGTYLVLERYIDSVVTAGMSEGEKAAALSQSMHYDLVRKFPKVPVFLYGESDQETLLKGAGHCSCRARLLCALCQMIGLSARPVAQWTWRDKNGPSPDALLGGHTVAEVLVDGRWGFFDPQHHLYCADGAGRFYGIDEIRSNPTCFTRMPDTLVKQMQPDGYGEAQGEMSVFEYYWYKNFSPGCPIQISRHDVNAPYEGGWFWATPEVRAKQQRDTARHLALLRQLAQKGRLTDDVYQMGLNQFREAFQINDGELQSRA
jgi:hypothetical protein